MSDEDYIKILNEFPLPEIGDLDTNIVIKLHNYKMEQIEKEMAQQNNKNQGLI